MSLVNYFENNALKTYLGTSHASVIGLFTKMVHARVLHTALYFTYFSQKLKVEFKDLTETKNIFLHFVQFYLKVSLVIGKY